MFGSAARCLPSELLNEMVCQVWRCSFSAAFLPRFPKEIHSGLLEVISPSPHFYPDFSHLRESFGDPKERVR